VRKRLRRFATIEFVETFIEGIPQGSVGRVLNGILYEAIVSGRAFAELSKYVDQETTNKCREACELRYTESKAPLSEVNIAPQVEKVCSTEQEKPQVAMAEETVDSVPVRKRIKI
jgi:hypothetical protein